MKFDIQKELQRWKDKATYDVRFKDDTKANLKLLDKISMMSMEHFTMVSANSEPLVYKIARYWIEHGMNKADDFVFLDGTVLQSYIGDDSAEWKQKDRLDGFFEIFSQEYRNKWVLIPLMDFEIDTAMSIYLVDKFRKTNAIGLVFCAEGENLLAQVLVQQVRDPYLFQFPKETYRKGRKRLIDDEW